MNKFWKFEVIVGTETQRKRLLKFIDSEKIVDDLVWTNDTVYQSTWKYPEKTDDVVLSVSFRTHCKDPLVIHDKIISKMGKAFKLGFLEIVKK